MEVVVPVGHAKHAADVDYLAVVVPVGHGKHAADVDHIVCF